MADMLTATPAAIALIEGLRREYGPLAIFQSGGCCDGSSPICMLDGELPPGAGDILLGELAGTRVYIDGEQYARWRHPPLELDVADGPAQGFSLSAPDAHLVTRTPSPSHTAGG